MKKLKIFWKLLLSIFLVSAFSILSFGILFYYNQKQALIDRTLEQVHSINILKKEMVEKSLSEDEKFVWHFIRKVMLAKNFTHKTVKSEFHEHKDFLKDFCKDYGHLDVQLLDKNEKVIDYLNYTNGIFDSLQLNVFTFKRIFQVNDSEYKIALISSASYLEKLMFERTGMGNTGESYLTASNGRLITKSRFFPNQKPFQIVAHPHTISQALKVGSGLSQTVDYRKIEVLSAYARIQHKGLKWVIISEIDLSEAMEPVVKLRWLIFYLSILVLILTLLVTLYLSKSISRNIILVSNGIDSLSKGIIPEKMPAPFYPNEKGKMKVALNSLIDSFERITDFAKEIGNGNLNANFVPKSDADQLGKSLLNMRTQLIQYRERQENLSKRKALFLLEGQENERKRIARDLHDGLGQWLTGLKLKIASADIPFEQKQELKELASETIEEVRRITNNLMPSVLLDFGLDAAVRQIITAIQKQTALQIEYEYHKLAELNILPFEIQISLYRIVQEALNNILKHSKARLTRVALIETKNEIGLSIIDNGQGFILDSNLKTGNGIVNMKERVRLFNGTFEMQSSLEGTKINISIPLQ